MSREIKFRLYSKPAKKYIDYITIGFSKSGELRMYSTEIGVGPVLEDNYIVEQFTGLLDQNGKEIYEGDIVKTYDSFPIEFHDGRYWLGETTLDDLFAASIRYDIEVIGNIHENKEFLEGEK